MPFFIADPEWQARLRDGIPGQSLIHRPAMEGSDCSSSDDEDNEIEENPDPNRQPETSHPDPHSAVEEYRRRQLEEIVVALKDFDPYAARYPPEAIPKPRHVLHCCVIGLIALFCVSSYAGRVFYNIEC